MPDDFMARMLFEVKIIMKAMHCTDDTSHHTPLSDTALTVTFGVTGQHNNYKSRTTMII